MQLGGLIKNQEALQDYLAATNGTWTYVNRDVILEATNATLYEGVITVK